MHIIKYNNRKFDTRQDDQDWSGSGPYPIVGPDYKEFDNSDSEQYDRYDHILL